MVAAAGLGTAWGAGTGGRGACAKAGMLKPTASNETMSLRIPAPPFLERQA